MELIPRSEICAFEILTQGLQIYIDEFVFFWFPKYISKIIN